MLYSILKALCGETPKENNEKNRKNKLSEKEKSELEYRLWEMAEDMAEDMSEEFPNEK